MTYRRTAGCLAQLAGAVLTALAAWVIIALAVSAGPPWSFVLVGLCLMAAGAWLMAISRRPSW